MDYQLTQTGAQVQEILDDAPITQQELEAVEALLPEDVSAGNKLVDYNQMDTLLQAKQDKLTEQTTGTKVGDLSVKYGVNIGYGVTVGSDNQTKVAITPGSITKGQGANIFDALATIETVIPSAASAQNKLTDKNYVDSAIATSSANFVGTFESLAELQAVQNPTNNDYGFVIEQDAQGNEYYDRYKFNGTQWLFEYKVESTPFTADQWAAIQSGITSALVTKLNALPTAQQINSQLNGKQDTIADLAAIRSGAAAGTTAAANTGDKAYDAAAFSGLGRKNLPKNITTVGGTEKNVLTQAMVNTANTIYVIQYDYDLNGQTITLPANVTLQFDGGSLANGTIVGNHTKVSSGNVCFKKSLEFSGSWDGIIYTKWLEFISADDEYSEVAGVVTRNPNPTDNTIVFKQLEAILNGSGGGKVVFEKGYYQTGIIDDTNYMTNVYSRKKWNTMWLFSLKYVNIDLNGSTIKQLRLNTPTCTMFRFVNCDYACIHNGTIIGRATNFDYPEYTNYAGNPSRDYEFCSMIYQCGGYIEIYDINVSYCTGDNITVGSASWYDTDTQVVTNYPSQGFYVHDCEVSYCGRNGITIHSSYNGILENVNIHNIGSDAGNGEIGSDGVMGWNPRSGIDIEFEDGQGLVGKFQFNNLTITDCGAVNIGFGANQTVHSLIFDHLRSVGKSISFSNISGDVEVNNSYIETSGMMFIRPNITYNDTEILLTSGGNSLNSGTTFNRCHIHDNVLDGTSIFVENASSEQPAAYFNGCKIELHSTLFKFHVCKDCDITFLSSTMHQANGLNLLRCVVKGIIDTNSHSAGFYFSNNSQSVSNDIYLEACKVIDIVGTGGNGTLGFNTPSHLITFKNCIVSNCKLSPYNNGVIKCYESEFELCTFLLYTPSNADTGMYFDGCKLSNAQISQAGYVHINNSNVHLISGNFRAYHNNHYIVKNSNIADTGTTINENDAFTIDAENSSFTFNKAYKSTNMHFKNCIIGGLITEAAFAGTKENSVFITPLATSGTTAQRPSASVAGVGFKFFDTDLNSPVYSDGTNWVLSANGGEDEIDHGTSDTTFALTPNVLHKWGEVAALTLTLAAGTSGKINEYMFQFTSGTTPTVLTVPNTVSWVSAPNIEASTTYQASIVNNIGVIVGV